MRLLIGTIPAILLLAACAAETGGELNDNGFGTATLNNMQLQAGQRSAAVAVSERFAAAVPTTINFAFNSAGLDGEARAILTRQAAFIRQFPEVRFAVYGHTDLVGSSAYNEALGLRRAQAAVAFLVSQGVEAGRLQALVSRGETQPLVASESPERANRRTVTDVTGFVEDHPDVLDGKYAAIVYRDYVLSAGTTDAGGGGGAAAQAPAAAPQ